MDTDMVEHDGVQPSDEKFCQFYCDALTALLGHDVDNDMYEPFRRYFSILRSETNSWCEFYNHPGGNSNDMADLLGDTLFYRLAYVYRNSTVLSSAVAFHLENVFNESPAFLQKLLTKREVRICSLGCGPASDVVAIVEVLDTFSRARGIDLDILVTVIDIESGWKNTCYGVLGCLERFRNAITKVNFVQADLSKFYTDQTLGAIQNADIVSMVKFFSEFLGTRQDLQRMMKVMEDIIQPGSLLFFLDRPKKEFMKPCGDPTGKLINFDLIYEEVCDLHGLSVAAVERNYHLYNKLLGANVFNTCLKVFVRAWLKTSRPSVEILEASRRFRSRRHKFDGKRYLTVQYFEFEREFYEKMVELGWNRKRCDVYLSTQRKMLLDVKQELEEVVEYGESIRENVIVEYHRTGGISSANWGKYLKSRMNISSLKRAIYCELVINIRGSLKDTYI